MENGSLNAVAPSLIIVTETRLKILSDYRRPGTKYGQNILGWACLASVKLLEDINLSDISVVEEISVEKLPFDKVIRVETKSEKNTTFVLGNSVY